MKLKLFASLALAAALGFAATTSAQESSFETGGYSDVSAIDVLDGQSDNYMDYLSGSWKSQQEWRKSKGYISGYQVLANPYAREGEPDLYLVISYDKIYDAAEQKRQRLEFEAFMKADSRKLGAQFAARGSMRKSMGQQQLRVIQLK